jgi:hypothetical protein
VSNANIYSQMIVAIFAIILMYLFARWASEKAFDQVEEANKKVLDSHEKFVDFVESAYTKNICVTEGLISTFKDYLEKRDEEYKKGTNNIKKDN